MEGAVSPTMPIADLIAGYRTGEIDPVAVTRRHLDRIATYDQQLHAFLAVTAERAVQAAESARDRYRQGGKEPLPPLLGITVALKDLFHMASVVTTAGSAVLRDFVALSDSGVTRRLSAAGAVLLGKTNTAEFGQSATTENRLGPPTANPWDPARTPGGSSGGSAAAVAAGLATAAVGTDGGGSVRIPAAMTGLFGLKPTLGRIADEHSIRSMTGFSTPGPLTGSVGDARVLLGVLADATFPRRDLATLRIGYCARPEGRPVDPAVGAAVDRVATLAAEAGHDVEPVSLPVDGWEEIFGLLVIDDEHRERGHLLDCAPDLLSRYERATLEAARSTAPEAVAKARARLPDFRRRLADFVAGFDAVLTPTVAVPPFPLGDRPRQIDGSVVDRLWGAFPFTAPVNVAGLPAASLPCGMVGDLPLAAQLIAGAGAEGLLLDLSEQLADAIGFDRTPAAARYPDRAES